MKNITKDNKGITLVSLIITIILMLILTSVTVYTGLDTYKFSKVNAFVTEMQLIQAKVDELVEMKTVEELEDLGTEVTSNSAINSAYLNDEISSEDIDSYRYFTKNDLLQILDIDDANADIMINFLTREVVSTRGVEYNGNKYYTQYKLPGGQAVISSSTTVRKPSFAIDLSINGINSNITIRALEENEKAEDEIYTEFITNGMLRYKEENESNWQTITNYTEKENTYSVRISKSGNYMFRLQDNIDNNNYVEKIISITLANKPKTNLDLLYNYGLDLDSDSWAYATNTDGNNYVWIPRFAYKTDAETNTTKIKFIKGNSNIATDNTYIDNTWSVHDKFTTSEGTNLTGIWVSVSTDEIKQAGQNMLILLNDNTRTTLKEI